MAQKKCNLVCKDLRAMPTNSLNVMSKFINGN